MKIGFIGQGFIGKNMADSFERRGFEVVRYSLDEKYIGNKEQIKDCAITFIAVPTPSTVYSVNLSAIHSAIDCIGKGNIAVIKSTVPPGTTYLLSKQYPEIRIVHSPEFLREKLARYDVDTPDRTFVGIPVAKHHMVRDSYYQLYKELAQEIIDILPKSEYTAVLYSDETELIKYAGNVFLTMKVIFANMIFDVCKSRGLNYEDVAAGFGADQRIGHSHLTIDSTGRGAGGHCFIKDLEAFRQIYEESTGNDRGTKLLAAMIQKNNQLLNESGKDLELLKDIYPASLL